MQRNEKEKKSAAWPVSLCFSTCVSYAMIPGCICRRYLGGCFCPRQLGPYGDDGPWCARERELETSMTKRSGKGWVVGVGSRDWGSQGAYLLKVPPRAVAFRKKVFSEKVHA